MTLPLRIAIRYLRPRRLSFISIIGGISVVGIIIGSAALIIVLSMFNGFRGVAESMMTDFGAHVVVSVPSDRGSELSSLKLTGATSVSRVSSSKLVVRLRDRNGIAYGIGLDADNSDAWGAIERATLVGVGRPSAYADIPGVVVAAGMAERLDVYLGDTLQLLAPSQLESAITMGTVPSGVRARVIGFFRSNTARDVDASNVYLTRDVIDLLKGATQTAEYEIRLADPHQATEYAAQLQTALPAGSNVRTWLDVNKGMVDTMRLERMGSFVVLTLILLVAVFNIVVSLTLGVVEKQKDIAILRAMGMTDRMISSVFLYQGLIIGIVAVSIGVAIGVGLCVGQQNYHWIAFDMAAGYLVPALPMRVHAADVFLVAAVGLILASTAALYPAKKSKEMMG